MLRRASIVAEIDEPGQAEAAEAWLEAARDRLTHVSDQKGCGCCVLIWDVEGPAELLATLPDSLRAHPAPEPPGLFARLCRRLLRRIS